MRYKKTKTGVEYVTFEDMKRALMLDPKRRAAYEALQPKYALIRAILDARTKKGMTQKEIAKRAGTTQSAISRFESGTENPTLEFMQKVSTALGKHLVVEIR